MKQTRYVCPNCGSDKIEAEAWADINTETLNNFAEGGENYCSNCQDHFKGWCEVDVETGKCVQCWFGVPAQHDENFKPLERISVPKPELHPYLRVEYRTKGYKLSRDGRYEHGDDTWIKKGMQHLRAALTCFTAGGAPKTANRVRFAISSAYGAERNVRYRRSAWEEGRKKGHGRK